MGEQHTSDPERNERFVQLFLEHERRLFSFILTLVPSWSDADDLLQETSSTLWQKFHEFEEGTDFMAWALSVARYKVLQYRKQRRKARERFGYACFEAIAAQYEELGPGDDTRLEALRRCLSQLDRSDRELVRLRYEPGATTRGVAEAVGRSVNAVYKVLNRIHRQLLFCVRHSLAKESG